MLNDEQLCAILIRDYNLTIAETKVCLAVARDPVPHRVTAERLSIHIKTVKYHLTTIFKKLKLKGRHALMHKIAQIKHETGPV